MGRLTTHVLDTANGRPAAGVRIDFFIVNKDGLSELSSLKTNDDGRCDTPIAEGEDFGAGVYELHFHVGEYFSSMIADLASSAFFDIVPIRFSVVSGDQNYHVPLLLSPFGYSTYRGS
jgi:5-hydroxyisourate hydrolase